MANPKQITISARVSEEVGAQIDQLAHATNRSRSWVLGEALRSYLAREMQYLSAVQDGIDAYKAGDVLVHSDVVAMFAVQNAGQSGK